MIGDTWYSVGTNRFPWHDDNRERPLGPEAGFQVFSPADRPGMCTAPKASLSYSAPVPLPKHF